MVVYYELRICNRHANFFTVQEEAVDLAPAMDEVLLSQTWGDRLRGKDDCVRSHEFCEYTF